MALLLLYWRQAVIGVLLLVPLAWGTVMHVERNHYRDQVVSVRTQFDAFKAQVAADGKAAQARTDAEITRQKGITDETVKTYDVRIAAVLDRYKRLLNSSAPAGSGGVPAVPDTARPTDDSARDQRLLEVLRAADVQTQQLIELQAWVREQGARSQ